MALNEGQQEALQKLQEFLRGNKQFFTLTGPAGTGKSYVITQFVRTAIGKAKLMRQSPPRFFLAAPTHKAVGVLADMLEEDSLQIEVGTIHSLLGLYLTANGEEKQLADGGKLKITDYDILIIDEGSMVGKRLFQYLSEKLHMVGDRAPKVIFMGDSYQLDPVKEAKSPVFDYDGATLTQQMRQVEGNPIGELIAEARAKVDNGRSTIKKIREHLNEEGDGVHVITGPAFQQTILDTYASDEYRADPNFCKILAWTNKAVDRYNRIVREHLYGKEADQIEVGEILVMQSPAVNEDGQVILHTEQMVQVRGIANGYLSHLDEEGKEHTFKVLVVSGTTKDGIAATFDVLDHSDLNAYLKYEKALKKQAFDRPYLWGTYWQFVDMFAKVRPPFACTVHKAQGSSFTNVFVVMTDLRKNPKTLELNKLLYVAFSRARQNIIVNTPAVA